jgi:hypothetical protein
MDERLGLLGRYDRYRYDGFKAAHKSYRELIDKINAFCRWVEPIRKTDKILEQPFEDEVSGAIDQIERLVCDLVSKNRGFLEDPVILGYYRASAVYQNDQFFTRLGQALKIRTAPHASNRREDAMMLAAFLECGRSLDDFNAWKNQGLSQGEADKAIVTPEAQRKLLKRHGLTSNQAKGDRTQNR